MLQQLMFHKILKGKTNKIFTDTFSDIKQSSAVWYEEEEH